jgi:hypothetical protein
MMVVLKDIHQRLRILGGGRSTHTLLSKQNTVHGPRNRIVGFSYLTPGAAAPASSPLSTAASCSIETSSLSSTSSRLQQLHQQRSHNDHHVLFSSSTNLAFVNSSSNNNTSLLLFGQKRFLSSTTGTADASVSSSSNNNSDGKTGDDNNKEEKKKKTDGNSSNIFLDNLGKIFLAVIASVILSLVRSSYNTSTRATLRNKLEDDAVLDPAEIDDLRIANSEFTPDIFRDVIKDVYAAFPTGTASYDDFVHVVRTTMARSKGEAFTVELGHLIDRVVADILMSKQDEGSSTGTDQSTAMPVSLWLATLSLALSSDVKDRIRILYEILQQEPGSSTASTSIMAANGESEPCVTISQVQDMVDYLQSSCQLPADTQIVPTEHKYPVQEWQRGGPKDLVPWEGTQRDLIDLRTFATILRSKSVCAWGECYHRKDFSNEEV